MASGDLVPPNDSPIGQAIEGECLPEAEAISWPQCFEILRANWAASPEEVCLWGANGAIRFYSPVPRDGAYPPAVPGFFDEPMDTFPWEMLCRYKFSRAEIERFSPQNEALDGPLESLAAVGKDRYWVAMHNPSGRYLSFDQAVAFLRGPSVGAAQDAPQIEAIIWSEVELKRIWPRHPFGHRKKFRTGLRDACFTEGSVLMVAREHWGANLDRWDTASSPPAPSDDGNPTGIDDAMDVENRAREWVLGEILTVAEIAQLHPDGDDFAKRMSSAWLVYEHGTTSHSSGGQNSAPSQAAETGLKAFLNEKRMLDLFGTQHEQTSGAALEELANQPQFGACVDVRRDDLRAWLIQIGEWPLPEDSLLALWCQQDVSGSGRGGQTQREENPSAEDSGDPSADPISLEPNTEGMVAWQAAALRNWDTIEKDRGAFPSARKVLTWLREQGPRDVFPKEQPRARDLAEWLDWEGNRQTLTQKNLANRMSEWRQWSWIPSRKK